MPESGNGGDQSRHPHGVAEPKGCSWEAPSARGGSSELSGDVASTVADRSAPSAAGMLTAHVPPVQSEVLAVEWFELTDQSTDGGYFDEAFHEEGSRWFHPG
jgi:hypothetical protein